MTQKDHPKKCEKPKKPHFANFWEEGPGKKVVRFWIGVYIPLDQATVGYISLFLQFSPLKFGADRDQKSEKPKKPCFANFWRNFLLF